MNIEQYNACIPARTSRMDMKKGIPAGMPSTHENLSG
jgi:hypothetical protein